jgi:hypothetical protein
VGFRSPNYVRLSYGGVIHIPRGRRPMG